MWFVFESQVPACLAFAFKVTRLEHFLKTDYGMQVLQQIPLKKQMVFKSASEVLGLSSSEGKFAAKGLMR